MTVGHAASGSFACFYPKSLYKMRELLGKLELSSNKVTHSNNGSWDLAPCFLPYRNLGYILGNDSNKKMSRETEKRVKENLKRFAKRQVNDRRKHRRPFNDFFKRFPSNKAFVSASLPHESGAHKASKKFYQDTVKRKLPALPTLKKRSHACKITN